MCVVHVHTYLLYDQDIYYTVCVYVCMCTRYIVHVHEASKVPRTCHVVPTRKHVILPRDGYCSYVYTYETLGLSMELNDDILVQTTSPQTIARIKRVKSRLPKKVA